MFLAEEVGPRRGSVGSGIDLDNRPLAARERRRTVLTGAEEPIHATRVADALDPDVDAHGLRPHDGAEVLDAQLAHDMKLIGVPLHVALPLPSGAALPRLDGAPDL